MSAAPVPPDPYTRDYFLEDCGGSEFFSRFGPKVLKPQLAYCLKRAGIGPGMRILDVGCGRGELLFAARAAGAGAVGTDFAAPALALARETSGCPVLRCDAKSLPFAPETFDRVFLIGVADHLLDWELERCFSEIGRVLKPEGFAVVHTCANRLYYKVWSYRARAFLARALSLVRFPVRLPSPPRSDSDAILHINEHSVADLVLFFKRIGWQAQVEPRPNYKLVVRDLYPEPLPPDFPLRPAPAWRARLYLSLLFHWPLSLFLGRELFAVARPKRV